MNIWILLNFDRVNNGNKTIMMAHGAIGFSIDI